MIETKIDKGRPKYYRVKPNTMAGVTIEIDINLQELIDVLIKKGVLELKDF